MRKMRKFLNVIVVSFLISLSCISAHAEFFKDIIVTSPVGIWTDERAYATIADAITAIGSNEQKLVIASQETVTDLTIPSNISLKFVKDGMITYSGNLNIQSPNISAPNRQIFNATGVGEADFARGTNLRASWFEDLHEMFDQTLDNYVTCIIDRGWSANVDADCQVGNNVTLKWEGPGHRIVINSGFELSNIKNIDAGSYQIFGGSGDLDFVSGSRLNTSWFAHFRNILTWIESENVTLLLDGDVTVEYTNTIPNNVKLDFISRYGRLIFDPGITLTVSDRELPLSGFESLTELITSIPTSNITVVVDQDDTVAANLTIPDTYTLRLLRDNIITISAGATLTFDDLGAQLLYTPGQRLFDISGGGLVKSTNAPEIYAGLFGAVPDGTTDNTTALRAALTVTSGSGIGPHLKFLSGIYECGKLTLYAQTKLSGVSMHDTILRTVSGTNDDFIVNNASDGIITIEDMKIDHDYSNQTAGSCIKFSSNAICYLNRVDLRNAKEYGLEVVSANHIIMTGGQIKGAQVGGVLSTSSEQINFYSVVIELNEGWHIKYTSALSNATSNVIGCWFESVGETITNAIILNSGFINITGNKFNMSNQNSDAVIRLTDGGYTYYNYIAGNSFANINSQETVLIDSGCIANFVNSLSATGNVVDNDGSNIIITKRAGVDLAEKMGADINKAYTFTANDATPSVKAGKYFITNNSGGGATITKLDDLKAGQEVFIKIGDAVTTIDFTGTNMKGNAGVDWSPAAGDWMHCIGDGTNAICIIGESS